MVLLQAGVALCCVSIPPAWRYYELRAERRRAERLLDNAMERLIKAGPTRRRSILEDVYGEDYATLLLSARGEPDPVDTSQCPESQKPQTE
jgi:hypothetical protein